MKRTLQNICCDAIRQNWNNHIINGITKTPYYDTVWSDWENKYAEFTKNVFYPILKRFVMGNNIGQIESYKNQYHIIQEDERTLILKGLDNADRKQVHRLCDNIGLHHESKQIKKGGKHLWIYKPKVWLWEYTEKNPYSESDEVYQLRDQIQIQIEENRKKRMKLVYCDGCDCDGWDKQLYCSWIVRELYCDDCLETLSDGYGNKLGDHKFEPIN